MHSVNDILPTSPAAGREKGAPGHHPDPGAEPHLSAAAMAQWHVDVAADGAVPGVMELFPVSMAGRICDFKCLSASPQAAALLGANPEALINRTLRQIVVHTWQAKDLIAACVGVMRSGRETTYASHAGQGALATPVLHRIIRTRTGLSVMLTSPAADERKQDAERALWSMKHPPGRES